MSEKRKQKGIAVVEERQPGKKQKNKKIAWIVTAVAVVLCVAIVLLSLGLTGRLSPTMTLCRKNYAGGAYYRFYLDGKGKLPSGRYATIRLSDGTVSKDLTLMLLPEYAPETVENFIAYASEGYYDGTVIHRIVPNGCIQGGGMTYTESGYVDKGNTKSPVYGEFKSNGFAQNKIAHLPGVISAARTVVNDSATSQFFLCFGEYASWNGEYAAFGFLPYQEDIDFITEIGNTTALDGNYAPVDRVITIEKVTVWEVTDD